MRIEYREPRSLGEAAELLQRYGSEARVLAGGTSVVLMLRQQLIAPGLLVSLARLPGQAFIRLEADGLHIGALATLREIEKSEIVRSFCPALSRACGLVGNIRVRSQATLGGNLSAGDYAADPPAMLSALGARLGLYSARGSREVPLDEFLLGFYSTALEPDELLTEVLISAPLAGARSAYQKYASLSAEGRPCVAVGVAADLDEDGNCQALRIAVGAALETPQRLPEVEGWAVGRQLTDDLVQAVAEAYSAQLEPLSDARGSAWYRREMIRVFVRRALEEVRDGGR